MKLLGILFVIATAGSAGFRIAGEGRKSCDMMRQLLSALQILRNEIAFCGTKLPKAMALMAVPCRDQLEAVLANTAREMDKCAWMTPLDALKRCTKDCKNEPFVPILTDLMTRLGTYDTQAQLQSVDLAREQCEERLCLLEQENRKKGKLYETLGICAGVAVSILLI